MRRFLYAGAVRWRRPLSVQGAANLRADQAPRVDQSGDADSIEMSRLLVADGVVPRKTTSADATHSTKDSEVSEQERIIIEALADLLTWTS